MLTKCYRCDALYGPGPWVTVRDMARGTESASYVKVRDIHPAHCPICDKPPLLEKPAQPRAM